MHQVSNGVILPFQLYGHVLRIIVTSIRPVTRIVINTSVQFTLSPDEAAVEPPEPPARQHFEAVAKQEASLLRVLTKRNNAPSAAPRRRKASKPRPKAKQPTESNNHNVSTASLAMDECSPWTASEPDDQDVDGPASMLGPMLSLQLEDSRPLSPSASPRKGPTAEHVGRSPTATIDKKKMQLQRLRAHIRVRGVKPCFLIPAQCADTDKSNVLLPAEANERREDGSASSWSVAMLT
jgi:hypothetical protein